MRRDFPEHHQLVKSSDYQDLYTIGAYWCIDRTLTVDPGRILFTSPIFTYGGDKFQVSTRTCRVKCDYECPRYPGQMWVHILRKREFNKLAQGHTDIVSSFSHSGQDYLFFHGEKSILRLGLHQMEKWNGSRFDKIMRWLHAHFHVIRVDLTQGGRNESLSLEARLREDQQLGVLGADMDDEEWKTDLRKYSLALSAKITRYSVYKIIDHFGEQSEHEMFSHFVGMHFYRMNEEELPTW
jgi:hypothetical protein